MKYKLTIWNAIIVVLLPILTYVLIKQEAEANTILAAALIMPVLIVGAILDLILQIFIKNRKVLAVIEAVFLVGFVVINNMK